MKSVVKKIALSSGIFLLLSMLILMFAHSQIEVYQPRDTSELSAELFCGIKSDNQPETKEGKALFRSNCAACHHKNKRRTGPALAKVDSSIFRLWLSIDYIKIDTTKFNDYGMDFHKINWGSTFSHSEVTQIIDYCIQ